jgi:hypothetical protein
MDLVGPITPSTVSGFKYFFTIVDQYSSFKFVRFLKAKLDTLWEFQKFISLVENMQGCKVKELVSDRGGRVHKQHICQIRGILQVFSPPETPEHNGYAESCKAQKCPKDLLLSAERDDVRMTLLFLYKTL